ncbi:MAG: diacylglycerol kinase [Candidatus Fervidibacterota bacterium]
MAIPEIPESCFRAAGWECDCGVRSALIVNPIAKRGRAVLLARRAQKQLQEAGWECELWVSERGEHVRVLTERAVAEGMDAVLVAGGDGTIHYAIQVLAHTDIPLGIIPCGRGNDLVRNLGIPYEPERAAEVIAAQHTRRIDLGQIHATNFPEPRYFEGIVTCGFDSAVADFVHRHRVVPGGWIGYFGVAMMLLARFRFPFVRVRGEGLRFEGRVLLVATANCPSYGGGMWIAPTAQMDDGLLHVCIVRSTSKIRIALLFPTVFTGKHILEPEVSLHALTEVHLEGEEPLPLFADGEPIGTTPAVIQIVPHALRVFVPAPF